MDPIAHTLTGATLAQTGLKKMTPLATPVLVIGANLPDIDVVYQFIGHDIGLYHRRGLTHGILALIILPLLLAGAAALYDRFVRRRWHPEAEPAKIKALILLSYIGVLSHPALDWLNTYGVRLLMPFSGEWFYGDMLFIIDPWMWLLMGASAVFASSRSWLGKSGWALLGIAMSALITAAPMVPASAKLAWWIGITLIFGFRMRGFAPERNQRTALACVAVFCAYLAMTALGNSQAKQTVLSTMPEKVTKIMTNPLPANPFARQVIAVTSTHYHGFQVPLLGAKKIEPIYDPVPIEAPDAVVAAALKMEEIKGFVNWMRFPVYEKERTEGGYKVTIRDLRYVLPDEEPGGGIGIAQVFVPDFE